ncbi:hypothetical protein VRU48_18925 [Pedobacter sp. KR3-3]|uniref:DUF2975 domain-containing protein n=1 Tax=Pedobacter albus TaxID=3113905 RepID=A0ABU7ICI1_9SPHI|nr:hypothetical protein [Pedobacter sp. KR3-3]MEE1947208.1 hypothetical protein [Pedobacter sp. KR3-3]
MNLKTLWTIILKTLGVYFLLHLIAAAGQLLAGLISIATIPMGASFLAYVLMPLVMFTIYLFIPLVLIFKSDWLIEKLKLAQGFEQERVDANINTGAAINIALIILGGYVFIDSAPVFFQQTFTYLQNGTDLPNNTGSGSLLIQLAKTIIGAFLVLKHQAVSQFIIKQGQANN